jgi:hypothetical protein
VCTHDSCPQRASGLESRSSVCSAVSGLVAGAAMVAVAHPLASLTAKSVATDVATRGSTVAAAKHGVSLAGLRTLYKGAPVVSSALSAAVCLGAFDIVKRNMQSGREQPTLSPAEVGQAGCAAGAVAGLFEKRAAGFVSRKAIETGIFFGVANLVRTSCFAADKQASAQALIAGGLVGGSVSEAARLTLENVAAAANSVKSAEPSAGLRVFARGMGAQVARSLPGTLVFVVSAGAAQKCIA